VGSFGLVALAAGGQDHAFLILFLLLALTDWLDGKLAILLHQRSVFGARLDSAADATFYTALLIGLVWLRWSMLRPEMPWIAAAILSYAVTTGAGLWKFGRVPSYHTRGAKLSWGLAAISAVCILARWSVWPLRVTMVVGTLTNLEATLMTTILPCWQADVPSLWHALRRAKTLRQIEESQGNR